MIDMTENMLPKIYSLLPASPPPNTWWGGDCPLRLSPAREDR